MIKKNEIRKEVLNLRKSLLKDEVVKKSIEITKRLINTKEFDKSRVVMAYMDFGNEVMTEYIIRYCFETGKRLALPLVDSINEKKAIEAYLVKNLAKDLSRGTYGIMEPVKENTIKLKKEDIDIIVVPGVAFDTKRNRIGYGAGYYDGFLKGLKPGCYKAGIAYEMQIYPSIPKEKHDIALDAVITESRIISDNTERAHGQ